jgi:hypothetical protein
MMARVKQGPRKVVPFQLKLDEPDGHTGELPKGRGWDDGNLSVLDFVVPEEGLEPSQGYPYRILSPARLPFHHSGTEDNINNEATIRIQERVHLHGDNAPFRRVVSSTPVTNSRRRASDV